MQDVKMSKLSNDKLGKLYIAKFRIACYALNVLQYIIQKTLSENKRIKEETMKKGASLHRKPEKDFV